MGSLHPHCTVCRAISPGHTYDALVVSSLEWPDFVPEFDTSHFLIVGSSGGGCPASKLSLVSVAKVLAGKTLDSVPRAEKTSGHPTTEFDTQPRPTMTFYVVTAVHCTDCILCRAAK